MGAGSKTTRILAVDVARFYAIALVFYGHFIEERMLLKNPAAASQYKFIYSFHMVLFIVLAGYVSQESDVGGGAAKFIKHRFFSRLLPFLFFTLLMMVPPIFFPNSALSVFIAGCAMTAASLVLCIPLVFVFTKFVPQLVGRPKLKGPLLKNLI